MCRVCLCVLQAASYEFTTLTCVPGIVRYRGEGHGVICVLGLARQPNSARVRGLGGGQLVL